MRALNLSVPKALMSVIHYYEDSCVMACCGPAALNLSPQRVLNGMKDHGVEWAKHGLITLDELIELVSKHSGRVVSGTNDFGHTWKSSTEALHFLESVRSSLKEAIDREHAK